MGDVEIRECHFLQMRWERRRSCWGRWARISSRSSGVRSGRGVGPAMLLDLW